MAAEAARRLFAENIILESDEVGALLREMQIICATPSAAASGAGGKAEPVP